MIVLSFLLLLAVFRSVLVAAKAAVLNLLSIIAAYGVVAYAAEGGWFGQLFGITTPTPIPAFIPMMMFAILFGLSMDYEVFLLSRVREEYLRTGDNTTAVADGLAATAKVITAAALIMTAVFGAFILDPQIFLKIIGIGMAAAVVIDATIIRLVLVPATMELLGDKNWWMPAWLDRIVPHLDIEGDIEGAIEARPAEPRTRPPRARARPGLTMPDLTMETDMHVYQPTITHSRTWPQAVLRWMPTFLGFPIGGFAAEIVGPIDAVAPAVVGGAITGAILGFAQWLGMRRYGPPPVRWIIATAAGLAVGLGGGRQCGRLSHQHRRTRRARRGLWCRHRRRASHRPAPHARAGRRGRGRRSSPGVVGARLDRHHIVRHRCRVAVHRVRLERGARRHRRHIGPGGGARQPPGRARLTILSRRGSCRPYGRCAPVPSS